MLKKILHKLDGLHYPQEYLCLANGYLQRPLRAYLLTNGRVAKDITHSHAFTGYCPLVFVLPQQETIMEDRIEIIFTQQDLSLNEIPQKKDAIARLSLKLIRKQPADDVTLLYYEGDRGDHRFLSSFHQAVIGWNNRLYNKKPGNVFLHDNLYKQVQIAYSIPRSISMITVSNGHLYNLFPTDLHGPVNEHYYVGSLRHGGKACQQVADSGQIVLSQVSADSYKMAYSLGKNHMQDLRPREDFPFAEALSAAFFLPLPQGVVSYRELELKESFDHGIHKLLLFKIVSQHTVREGVATLTHIHNAYATWRHNKGLAGNYLLR